VQAQLVEVCTLRLSSSAGVRALGPGGSQSPDLLAAPERGLTEELGSDHCALLHAVHDSDELRSNMSPKRSHWASPAVPAKPKDIAGGAEWGRDLNNPGEGGAL
jgi:hypothetical protein